MRGYIIVFKESATKDQIDEYMKHILESGGSIKYSYDSLMKAVAATVSESFVNSFGKDDIVDFIELDGVATTQGEGGFGV